MIFQKFFQRQFSKFLVDDVFNTIVSEDVLEVITPVKWRYKNKELTEGQILALRNQATIFYKSDLWKILKDELTFQAQKRLYFDSKTEEDIIAGKLMFQLIKTIDSRLKLMIQDR